MLEVTLRMPTLCCNLSEWTILSALVRGGSVDSGDEFDGREGKWRAGAADVCVAGACGGEVISAL